MLKYQMFNCFHCICDSDSNSRVDYYCMLLQLPFKLCHIIQYYVLAVWTGMSPQPGANLLPLGESLGLTDAVQVGEIGS